MKTTIAFLVLLAGTAALFESCSSSGASASSSQSESSNYPYMIGKIEVIGNEPFTKLALRVDESHLYFLRSTKDLEKELVQHQEGLVKLYYSGRQEKAREHYLDVDHFEKIDNH